MHTFSHWSLFLFTLIFSIEISITYCKWITSPQTKHMGKKWRTYLLIDHQCNQCQFSHEPLHPPTKLQWRRVVHMPYTEKWSIKKWNFQLWVLKVPQKQGLHHLWQHPDNSAPLPTYLSYARSLICKKTIWKVPTKTQLTMKNENIT